MHHRRKPLIALWGCGFNKREYDSLDVARIIKFLKEDPLYGKFSVMLGVAGAEMAYVAMFDEFDESTNILKCTNDPPVGESKFLTYEDMPSDHYLWLTAQGTRLIRGEIKDTDNMPKGK